MFANIYTNVTHLSRHFQVADIFCVSSTLNLT